LNHEFFSKAFDFETNILFIYCLGSFPLTPASFLVASKIYFGNISFMQQQLVRTTEKGAAIHIVYLNKNDSLFV